MLTFDLIAGSLLVAGWLAAAYLPWVVLSVITRGNAGMAMLPLSLFAGLTAALAVPLLGATGGRGLASSFLLAMVVPAAMLAARRLAFTPVQRPDSAPISSDDGRPPPANRDTGST